ncbi:hypothetical protein EYF80_014367 [Liparis tanakae]|uniref:Uncharacterized protein n=1 Tax=Liparis tanakae TaxID=230148 RepID=A0A4Z2IBP8_9TELE|nr:hypothetical protein EYF80_014367 [Liparis tanakae]
MDHRWLDREFLPPAVPLPCWDSAHSSTREVSKLSIAVEAVELNLLWTAQRRPDAFGELLGDLKLVVTKSWPPPGQQLIQHHTIGEHVRQSCCNLIGYFEGQHVTKWHVSGAYDEKNIETSFRTDFKNLYVPLRFSANTVLRLPRGASCRAKHSGWMLMPTRETMQGCCRECNMLASWRNSEKLRQASADCRCFTMVSEAGRKGTRGSTKEVGAEKT